MSDDVLVLAESVSKKFCRSLKRSLWYGVADMAREASGGSEMRRELRKDEFWAVDDVSFAVRRGECLGLIGHNGAGKTTLLRVLNGLIKPDRGRITIRGRIGALIALGAGFNPILTGRENIYVNGTLLGLSLRQLKNRINDIIDFAGIHDFIDSPVQSYSSGMLVRLGFAVATSIDPDVLILDEVLAVGDANFRAKCFKRIGALSSRAAIIFVSHDQSQVTHLCDKTIVLDHGRSAFIGETAAALERYKALQPATENEPTAQFHSAVKEFQLRLQGLQKQNEITAGEPIEVVIDLYTSRSIPVGVCHINFVNEAGLPCAQVDLAGSVQRIPEGRSRLVVQVLRLDLASGVYSVNCAIFGDSGKQTIVHSIGCSRIRVHGSPFLWIGYKIPVGNLSWITDAVLEDGSSSPAANARLEAN